ncbi:MAG: redox-sensing transcriptional repressor Rex [Acidobacteriota bacterium]|nr:redox-sensing transcriptional repressor Rex [Acidobacteriota bacterium]MDE2964065.1 redox-sensing transcriptional repressor Rex [Acidobacteriota bacterium]
MKTEKISEFTINRLSIYLRCLNLLAASGVTTTSSQALAEQFQLNSAQIRKDLTYFGEFGVRGVGYNVTELRAHLNEILGLDRQHRIGIVGAGNLGMALANYRGYEHECFQVAALFDKEASRLGITSRSGVVVHHIDELDEVVARERIVIGVVAVPAENAQEVVDRLTEAGISAILNFAPVRPSTRPGVQLKTMDLAISFESLSYFLSDSGLDGPASS